MLLLTPLFLAQRGFVNDVTTTRYAAFSIVESTNGTLRTAIGTVSKHPQNPLLVQDKPWEPRLDNAYPNVAYTPGDPLGAYRMWYGGFVCGDNFDKSQGSNRVNALHYANSSDGIVWEKPSLGLFDLSPIAHCTPAATAAGRNNNLLLGGDGTGIFYDEADSNASRRFKAFGTMCAGAGLLFDAVDDSNEVPTRATDGSSCVSGTAVSADGLHFHDFDRVAWPAPQRCRHFIHAASWDTILLSVCTGTTITRTCAATRTTTRSSSPRGITTRVTGV